MAESSTSSRAGTLGIVSLVLAIIGGALSASGAWIPGGFVALVALVVGLIGRRRSAGNGATVATVGAVIGALVVVASIALIVADK